MKCLQDLEEDKNSTLAEPIDDSDDDPNYEEQPEAHCRTDSSDEDESDSDAEVDNTGNLNINSSHTVQEISSSLPEFSYCSS